MPFSRLFPSTFIRLGCFASRTNSLQMLSLSTSAFQDNEGKPMRLAGFSRIHDVSRRAAKPVDLICAEISRRASHGCAEARDARRVHAGERDFHWRSALRSCGSQASQGSASLVVGIPSLQPPGNLLRRPNLADLHACGKVLLISNFTAFHLTSCDWLSNGRTYGRFPETSHAMVAR